MLWSSLSWSISCSLRDCLHLLNWLLCYFHLIVLKPQCDFWKENLKKFMLCIFSFPFITKTRKTQHHNGTACSCNTLFQRNRYKLCIACFARILTPQGFIGDVGPAELAANTIKAIILISPMNCSRESVDWKENALSNPNLRGLMLCDERYGYFDSSISDLHHVLEFLSCLSLF